MIPNQQEGAQVLIDYTNYRGVTAIRWIVPERIYFGSTEYHPIPQWLLLAYDLHKEAPRTFAIADIRNWRAYS